MNILNRKIDNTSTRSQKKKLKNELWSRNGRQNRLFKILNLIIITTSPQNILFQNNWMIKKHLLIFHNISKKTINNHFIFSFLLQRPTIPWTIPSGMKKLPLVSKEKKTEIKRDIKRIRDREKKKKNRRKRNKYKRVEDSRLNV